MEVWISDRGRAIIAELMPVAEQFVQRMLRNLDDNEIRQLTALLERLFSDLQ